MTSLLLETAYYLILAGVVVSATAAVLLKGPLASIILLSVFSVFSTILFALLQAVDVAMAEAVIGAGLMTALFVTALNRTGGIR
ncbi:Uncharacterized MnhB-related membrane protein [Alkalispirochaeta americana]|uniref:Uncharacterized MnhB-related membrane protein n=1 Tax=Alkalispirochaeta americana TaxID=159291 RepID=A0A1N6TFZ6_9SPIO|nr:hydrogenase subunit MbhD domain-containing protein [Alkalispirochaeta americana]SIQ52174.1 Uncharacterized MnhB-related membrane protein [Alkalispirochaeta americana]